MAEESTGQDRTEAPTQRRLGQARDEGKIPVSSELPMLATLAAGTLLLAYAAPAAANHLARQLAALLAHPDIASAPALRFATLAAVRDALPFIAVPLAAALAAVLLQTGLAVSLTPLRPDPSRINPLTGLKRLFSPQSAIDTLKALLKLAAAGVILWRVLATDLAALAYSPLRDARQIPAAALALALRVCLAILAVQAVVAIFDLLWTRLSFTRRMRMSRQEVREEQRDTEGDPLIKARFKRLRLQRARRRMLAAVPKATVVVTNPTEYAVALAYDRNRAGAPRVVAKGIDHMAARIREAARAAAVPLVANPPLARALYRLDLETEVPPEHYKAVAEIIAYVWRLRTAATRPLST